VAAAPLNYQADPMGDTTNAVAYGATADFRWVKDDVGGAQNNVKNYGGGITGGHPARGLFFDLGSPMTQAVVIPYIDHPPDSGVGGAGLEGLESSVWLSNNPFFGFPIDPDAGPNSPNSRWELATLSHVYGEGFSGGANIVDGFALLFTSPSNTPFRYVSVSWGGPSVAALLRDHDNEIDAVAGFSGPTVIPEPASLVLFGSGLVALAARRRRKQQ
jgi:hypothetical protein